MQKARASYETVAEKAGEAAAYPGNWLYETWTGKFLGGFSSTNLANTAQLDSDFKEWLDTYGFPAPQPTTVRIYSGLFRSDVLTIHSATR